MERRTPLNRGTTPLARSRLKPQSAKRRAEAQRRRDVVTAAGERDGWRCRAETLVPEVTCWGPLDGDEIEARSQRPGGHLDVDNVQTLCRAHHEWRHAHPLEAARRGLRAFPKGYMGDDTGEREQHES